MSTSIRRPRRRPRVRSLQWRTFGWVLRREAAVMALIAHAGYLPTYHVRRVVATLDARRVRRLALYPTAARFIAYLDRRGEASTEGRAGVT